MKKILILIIILGVTFSSCKTDNQKEKDLLKKENELLKKELELERKERKIDSSELKNNNNSKQNNQKEITEGNKKDLVKSNVNKINQLYANNYQELKINNNGDFSFDMGSASAGRVSGNLRNLVLRLEHKPERPGCADICPEMELIHFECKNGKSCVSDPVSPNNLYESGVITFDNIKLGKDTYKLLETIRKNLN